MIAVLSWASDETQAGHLKRTAARHNVPLRFMGCGGNDIVLKSILNQIRSCQEPYVLLTDAYDVLVSRWDAAGVVSLIDAAPSGVIQSCEDNCWPAGDWCALAYPGPHGRWYAANGGQCCGRRDAVADLIDCASRYEVTAGGGSQERLHKTIAGGYRIGLDTGCRIFQTMSGTSSGFMEVRDGMAHNRETHSYPMFLHFNGRTAGIEEWRNLLA